jgi:hypothetical protein
MDEQPFMASSSCLLANEHAGKGGPGAQEGEYPMLRIIAAIGVSSALMFAPMVAFADESTNPPTPTTVKPPGNGPTKHLHYHDRHWHWPHWHHHWRPHHHHMMMKKPMMKPADKPMDAPK